MSRLVYGDYAFEDNSVWFTITKRELKSQVGRRIGYQEVWNVGGTFKQASQSALTTAIDAFAAGTATNGKNLLFYTDAGSTLSSHVLYNANTMNGVRVVGISYPKGNPGIWGSGVEYVTTRSFQITFAAEVYNPEGEIVVFHQLVRQTATGGPDFEVVEALQGPTQVQNTAQFTKAVVEQVGMAVGVSGYPAPAPPIWPQWLKPSPCVVEFSEPMQFGAVRNINFPVRWHYRFEAPAGQIGPVPPPLTFV